MKPGIKTSEFWITLVSLFLAVVVHVGVLSPAESEAVQSAATDIIKALFELGLAATGPAYVLGRSWLKRG